MTDSLFSDDNTGITENTDRDYAAELVGEGKKFKDIQALARAKAESDAFIERLKAENAEMRASLRGEAKLDEFFDKLKNIQNHSGNGSTSNTMSDEPATQKNSNNESKPALSVDDVNALLEQREQKRQEALNLEFAKTKLREAFGANAGSVLKTKAGELGMTEDQLDAMARTQPKAFLRLVEADKVSAPNSAAPRTQVNTAAIAKNANGEIRNNEYYRNLRRKIGDAAFFRPEVQKQLNEDMLRMRDAFF